MTQMFNEDAQEWKVIAPGEIYWTGTEITIQGRFDRAPVTYIIFRRGKDIGYAGSLIDAKKQAYKIAGDMVEVGLEP